MLKPILSLGILSMLIFAVPSSSKSDETAARPNDMVQILSTQNGNQLLIQGKLNGVTQGQYIYHLTTRKTGRSGTAQSSQSGKISVEHLNADTEFSSQGFSCQSGDTFEINLEVYDNGKKIGADRKELIIQ